MRAASALPPIANTRLPKTVRVSMSCSTIATTANTMIDHVSRPKPPVPSVPYDVSLTEIGKPFVIAAPAPENTRLVASVARNELIPSVVDRRPLNPPSSSPTATPPRNPIGTLTWTASQAEATPARK